ncbi:MAG: hypothetical protein NVSMB39_7140 [Candidatus Saccharimonadales bacterium]
MSNRGKTMALTTEDLTKITNIVESTLDRAITKAVAPLVTKDELDAKLSAAVSGLATKAELKDAVSRLATKADLDRMESRLTTSMSLLERDAFSRLDQHEARITRLEQARP